MADRLDTITAYRDLADHLDRNPHLAVPIALNPSTTGPHLSVQVRDVDFQAWRNTATDIGVEAISDGRAGYHAVSAIVIGRTALELRCTEHHDMDRQSFALLVGFGYQTPSIAKAV